MMFRIFCVALFACSLTFAGCDEANDGLNDVPATTTETLDPAGEPAAEVAVDAEAVVDDAANEEAVVVEETVSE